MAGILDIKTNQYMQGVDPATVDFDPETDSVEGLVKNIIDEDSILMQQAAVRGKQFAHQRGLLNSSMAGQASQAAVLDRAIPIAQQDAAQRLQNKQFNIGQENWAAGFSATAANQATLAANEEALQLALQDMRGEQAKELADIQGSYGVLIASNQSAAVFLSETQTSIANILANSDIPATEKDGLVQAHLDVLEMGLIVIGSSGNVDFAGLLDFGGVSTEAATTEAATTTGNTTWSIPDSLAGAWG